MNIEFIKTILFTTGLSFDSYHLKYLASRSYWLKERKNYSANKGKFNLKNRVQRNYLEILN